MLCALRLYALHCIESICTKKSRSEWVVWGRVEEWSVETQVFVYTPGKLWKGFDSADKQVASKDTCDSPGGRHVNDYNSISYVGGHGQETGLRPLWPWGKWCGVNWFQILAIIDVFVYGFLSLTNSAYCREVTVTTLRILI